MNIVTDIAAQNETTTARDWAKLLASYNLPEDKSGVFELCVTLIPLIILWSLTWLAVSNDYWIGLLLTIPMAGLLLRLFLIQHDCGHGAFFTKRTANDWAGRFIGVLTFTPYYFWKYAHNMHHAGSGNLSRRGFGDINTLTIKEYRDRSSWGRLTYRLYRNPFVMFGIGPIFTFLFDQRLPLGQTRNGWKPWISTMGTNLSIIVLYGLIAWLVGIKIFLLIHFPVLLIASTVGVWLFFVQHQFEDTSWDHEERWNWHEAALYGSSHYDLPQPLRWFTANIGLHHIHHLSSRIPYYRISQVIRDYPSLKYVNRLTVLKSFKCIHLTLWDEENRMMVHFREAGI